MLTNNKEDAGSIPAASSKSGKCKLGHTLGTLGSTWYHKYAGEISGGCAVTSEQDVIMDNPKIVQTDIQTGLSSEERKAFRDVVAYQINVADSDKALAEAKKAFDASKKALESAERHNVLHKDNLLKAEQKLRQLILENAIVNGVPKDKQPEEKYLGEIFLAPELAGECQLGRSE